MLQKLFAFLLIVTISFNNFNLVFCTESFHCAQEEDYFQHTIKQGETTYSISRMYGVTIEDIFHLNYGSENVIKAGNQLKIPKKSNSYFLHTIKSEETLYSISQKYGIKEENILEFNPGLSIETFTTGKIICIPIIKVGEEVKNFTNKLCKKHVVKVALLLPFGLKNGIYKNVVGKHMLEYYKGLLIALKDIKTMGISVDLQVFDIGLDTNLLQDIFNNSKIKSANLIIGGLKEKQIELISNFSIKYNIPYIIPFTSKSKEFLFYSNVYKVNTPQLYLYDKISSAFCLKYKDDNILFYIPNFLGNKMDFINIVQKDLQMKKITYKVIKNIDPTCSDIITVLDSTKNNVFVLFDDKQNVLLNFISLLKEIKSTNPHFVISFFGYPIWQFYSMKYMNDFFYLNIVFYSSFYSNLFSQKVNFFCNSYRYWYSKNLMDCYPKYGMLGYDIGMFFIQLLDKYSSSLAENINKLNYSGIQNNFFFKRINNCGGFINKNIYLIEFNENFSIISNSI